jgi:hypothetical protein
MKFEIVHTHRLDDAQFTALLAMLRPAAPVAHEEPLPVTPSEYETKFTAWLEDQGYPEAQDSHYRAAFAVLTGKRPVPQGFSRAGLREELKVEGAPLP